MPAASPTALSRRERQIMDIIYRRGRATAAEVLHDLPDPPSYSAVRAALRLLEEKGQLRHENEGARYVFMPTVPRDRARTSALSWSVSDATFRANAARLARSLRACGGLERALRIIESAATA